MRLDELKEIYKNIGIDLENVFETMNRIPVSLHCWQGDDVQGFDQDGPLTGGIQITGNYPGKARNYIELMEDLDAAIKLMPGMKKLNLHASYAIFDEHESVDRNKLEPKHFEKWVAYAKKRNMGIDFNPTFFSHGRVKDGLTLSSPDENIRRFWIEHGQACIRISEYFAKETGIACVMNIWTGDGYKDMPADRLTPRIRYRDSIDEILSIDYDKDLVKVCVESKVFGIGVESYTVGSSEFSLNYASTRDGVIPLMDNGHYHPTEYVSDKISSLLTFFDEIALHLTRPVRWDSDHVVTFDDETREMALEIVRNDAVGRVHLALDFFDASINRIAAWSIGFRSWQKSLLYALTIPHDTLKKAQEENNLTKLLILHEAVKMLPFGEVWQMYCEKNKVVQDHELYEAIMNYENNVLNERR